MQSAISASEMVREHSGVLITQLRSSFRKSKNGKVVQEEEAQLNKSEGTLKNIQVISSKNMEC